MRARLVNHVGEHHRLAGLGLDSLGKWRSELHVQVVADALAADAKFVKLSDVKGNVYLVPVVSLAYLEIGSEESRSVGFGA